MAELLSQDVVNHSQSVGDVSPSDVPATTPQSKSTLGDGQEGVVARENGLHTISQTDALDDLLLDDGTARSDTDTSRADGDAKSTDARPVKKIAPMKPVSFAKYSVPKVVAANAAKTQPDKAVLSTSSTPQPQLAGRPRLVAKTTSSLAQKVKPFKAAAPDPMQVWNKNRITPQPSTKNLTDEELKQQYGIHLTSRLQDNGEGKEAKWADIDDDEDDWAPETIEWGDGTKTTVNPADNTPLSKSAATSKPTTPATEAPKPLLVSKPSFATSIGPNATVLKLGARAESQQSQKAVQQPKGSTERPSLQTNTSTPAPVPAKSPWAKLPPVEKVSPVQINPVPVASMLPQSAPYGTNNGYAAAPPAREISADDFNRSWRDSAQPQLFMPNSGRYESVPESRRRMSRNDQGFRAPAVLQRPGQSDSSAPEPSPAFQTNRTSSDAMRRRASSTLSGDVAAIARRMSIRSSETPLSTGESAIVEGPEHKDFEEVTQATTHVTPAYQPRGGDQVVTPGQTDAEIEAQRAQQRRLMREQAELARKRRLEEEARQEAEKQERIRQKLLSLGPDPKVVKAEQEAKAKAEADAKAKEEAAKSEHTTPNELSASGPTVSAHPRPPPPSTSGEPQQYGMMKVHPMDSIKKNVPAVGQPPAKSLSSMQELQSNVEEISPEPPVVTMNGVPPEDGLLPEPIPRSNRPIAEARMNWGRSDHRSPPTSNLWGAPHNKALGNGTFDQTLAGYAPQDLSRASSNGQAWMNGRTPTVGQSPQLGQIHHHVPETRSQALQNMTSPEPIPLSINSEVDSMQPVRPPAPIGPPQQPQHQQPNVQQTMVNGYGPANGNGPLAGWNNFEHVARAQDRSDYEQFQRDATAKREEEKRTATRQQATYTFDENFKQVSRGTSSEPRHVANINLPSPGMFGAVGSMPPSAIAPQTNRGSRFFPPQVNGSPAQQPRAVTYSFAEIPRSPSPPPAEELESSHPAYEQISETPVIRLPPAKAVVKLPPAKPPTPPAPTPVTVTVTEQTEPPMPVDTSQPMTWAARAALPPPKPVAPLRAVSQPIVKNPSWQERFNGLLGNSNRKMSDTPETAMQAQRQSQPALAVTSATREPLDAIPAGSASVSLPHTPAELAFDDETGLTSKDVEDEEDLFEDREAGSLPILYFPSDAPAIIWPRAIPSRIVPTPPDAQSAFIFLGSQWKEEKFPKQQFAIIRGPGSDKSIKKDLPIKPTSAINSSIRPHTRGSLPIRRGNRGGKGRVAAIKAQQ